MAERARTDDEQRHRESLERWHQRTGERPGRTWDRVIDHADRRAGLAAGPDLGEAERAPGPDPVPGLEWVDAPPAKPDGSERWADRIAAIRRHPGQWAEITPGPWGSHIPAQLRKYGPDIEVTCRRATNGNPGKSGKGKGGNQFDIYVRARSGPDQGGRDHARR